MIHLVSEFTKCQSAFWNKASMPEKLSAFNLTVISGMATYISLQILKKESYLDLVHNFSFLTIPLQGINEFTAKSSIYAIFALTFFNQNLKGRVASWQVISVVTLGGYLYASTRKGYELLHPPKKESDEK